MSDPNSSTYIPTAHGSYVHSKPPSEASASSTPQYTTLYFGHSSNLSPRTLQQRCPGSLYIGLALLPGYKFIVSSLGFGNIVPSDDPNDQVYGTLSFLTAQHEQALDRSEEVPKWHAKVKVRVRRVTKFAEEGDDAAAETETVEATTYIDVNHTTVSSGQQASKEYLVWLRKAIEDGTTIGVPKAYFDKYFMQYLPEDEGVGREEKIMMVRTVQTDREDLRFVPREMLGAARKE